jgi:hypothetical protein
VVNLGDVAGIRREVKEYAERNAEELRKSKHSRMAGPIR